MAQGLGKNSPITLSLGKESYEAMIERHGQYVRWKQAKKCPCVTDNNQPDIHCKKCGGSGEFYDYQTTITGTIRLSVMDGIIELGEAEKEYTIEKIYNYAGVSFRFKQEGGFIQISDHEHVLSQGEQVDLVFRASLVSTLKQATLTRICNGFYELKDLTAASSKIQGVHYRAPCDIIGIQTLSTYTGEALAVKQYYKNCLELATPCDAPLIFAQEISYIKPVKFIILSQNLSKELLYLVQKHNGDAVCTFPYMYDVAEGDIITVLSGAVTNKMVIKRSGQDCDDHIPDFFVESICNIETAREKFIAGEDFILAGTNRIHWGGKKKPTAGENMSVTFRYHPTYRVAQAIAGLRTSEDQRIPRKVVLKLFSSYQEKRGVHFNL